MSRIIMKGGILDLFSGVIIIKKPCEMQGNASGSFKRSFLFFILFIFTL